MQFLLVCVVSFIVSFFTSSFFTSFNHVSPSKVKDIISVQNMFYGLKAENGISIVDGQIPAISNTGVLAVNGQSGVITVTATAGDGISVNGLKITNDDKGSGQNIFKKISVTGQTTITAGGNNDTLTFAQGSGIILTTNADSKTLTITTTGTTDSYAIDSAGISGEVWTSNGNGRGSWQNVPGGNGSSGSGTQYFQLNGEQLSPLNALWNDFMVGGTSTDSAKISLQAATGNGYFAGKLGIGTTSPTAQLEVSGADQTTELRLGSKYGSGFGSGILSFYSDMNLGSEWRPGYIQSADNGNWTGRLDFYTNGTTDSNKIGSVLGMSIVNGQVGVGTANPEAKLDVVGSSDMPQLIVRANSSQSNTNPLITLKNATGDTLLSLNSDNPSNIFLGINTGRVNSITGGDTGLFNTFIGANSGYENTVGFNNSSVGYNAMYNNSTGYNNSTFGKESLYNNVDGVGNSVLGNGALFSNTSGSDNVAIGLDALRNISTAWNNSAVGRTALSYLTAGDNNIAFGTNAGLYQADGTSPLESSSNSLYLGSGTMALTNGNTNEIVIGDSAKGAGSNSVVLGNDSITTTVLKGNVGIGTSAPAASLHVNGTSAIFGMGEGATPTNTTIRGAAASGLNIAGADFYFDASNGTGTGGSGSFIFQTGTTSQPTVSVGSTSSPSMAIEFPTSTLSWSHTVNSGNDRLLVVSVSVRAYQSVSSITFGGQSLTQLGAVQYGGGDEPRSEIWYLVAPNVGTDTITMNLTDVDWAEASATDFTGVDQTIPFGSYFTNTGSDMNPTITLPSASGEIVLGSLATTRGVTSDIGQTQTWNLTSDNNWQGAGSIKAGTDSTTLSWSTTDVDPHTWAIGAVSIKGSANNLGIVADTLLPRLTITKEGNVGIGTTNPTSLFTEQQIDSSGTMDNFRNASIILTRSVADNGGIKNTSGLRVLSDYTSDSGTYYAPKSILGTVQNSSTGTITEATGVKGTTINYAGGTITTARGLWSDIQNGSTGTIAYSQGLFINTPWNSGGGTITNEYGLYIENQNTGTNNWAIYSVGGSSYFGGNIGIGTTSPTTKLDILGVNTEAVMGGELISDSNDRDFSSDTGNWVGSDWSIAGGVASHTDGGATGSFTLTNSIVPTVGTTYQISFDINPTSSAGPDLQVTFGGQPLLGLADAGIEDTPGSERRTAEITATNSDPLTFTPSPTFPGWTGTIDNVSIVQITPSSALQTLRNADGTIGLELRSGGTGTLNSYIGVNAGMSNTTGVRNTAFGYNALLSNTTGERNIAIGPNALRNTSSGSYNVAIGSGAMFHNNSGSDNTALGFQALDGITNGTNNVGMGENSGYGLTKGEFNNFFGVSAGANLLLGSNNLYLGAHTATGLVNGATNEIVIGNTAQGLGSNTVVLGNDLITKTVLKGYVGVDTSNPGYALQVGNAGDGTEARANAWNSLSDLRFKDNVATLSGALDKILSLNGVSFNWKSTGKASLGLIAQDVLKVFPELVSTDDQGILSLNYAGLSAPLIQAIKQQQLQIVDLQNNVTGRDVINHVSTMMNVTVLQTLEAQGAVTFKSTVEFKGPAAFKALAEFFDNVIFHGNVSFEKAPLMSKSSAGTAIISAYSDHVDVHFYSSYEVAPIVTATLTAADATDKSFLDMASQAEVINITKDGFTILLPTLAARDFAYNWIAVAVKDSIVTKSSSPIGDVIGAQTATPSADIISATPSATVIDASPSASILVTPIP